MFGIEKTKMLVDEFSCERLSAHKENTQLIKSFTSYKSLELPEYLKRYAWREDARNQRAFYLVKERKKIVCYFSLQCGMLVKCHKKLLGGIVGKNTSSGTEFYIDTDKIEVSEVLPAMELAHFCINDLYRSKRIDVIKCGVREYSIGAFVFYKHIVPIVLEVAQKSGLRYLYLFCANDAIRDPFKRLNNYYMQQLNFRIMDDMACIRPDFDEDLECYTISIDNLQRDYERFIDLERAPIILEYLHEHGTLGNYQAKREFGIKDPGYLFICLNSQGLASVDAKNSRGDIVRIKRK